MAEVTLTGVDKIYAGGVQAVRDFNLKIEDGEFIVLVGPSGCGKSTTLRMVAGLEEISGGTVSIGDRIVNDVPPKSRDIAMVFQNYALYPHMTVRDNMAFGLKLRKYPKAQIEERIQEAATILGLEDLLDRRPKALSGGQRQRVAVGRAIVRKPAVFLFDEPLSNLDAKLRVQMRVEISQLHGQLDATMIYVTHDQVEAMTMGDRIVVMKDGIVHQVADPITLYDQPADKFVAGFIGTPPMNFFDGSVQSENGELWFKGDGGNDLLIQESHRSVMDAYMGKKMVLGVRPEDIGSNMAEQIENAPTIKATVGVVEPMGSESYVHLSDGIHSFVSRADAHKQYRTGDTVEMPILASKTHYFDPETEKTLV